MNKYRVTLTVEERAELERLVSVGKGAARKLTHARILLLADTATGPNMPTRRSLLPCGSASARLGVSASGWLPRDSPPPSTPERNRNGRTKSRLRGTSNRS